MRRCPRPTRDLNRGPPGIESACLERGTRSGQILAPTRRDYKTPAVRVSRENRSARGFDGGAAPGVCQPTTTAQGGPMARRHTLPRRDLARMLLLAPLAPSLVRAEEETPSPLADYLAYQEAGLSPAEREALKKSVAG